MVTVGIFCFVAIGALMLYGTNHLDSALPALNQQKPVVPIVDANIPNSIVKNDLAANEVLLQGTVMTVQPGSLGIQLSNSKNQTVAIGSNTKFFKRIVSADYSTKDTVITIEAVKKGSPVFIKLDSQRGEAIIVYVLANS